MAVGGEYAHLRKSGALTNLKVVRVMARRDLYSARAEIHFNIFIGNDGDLPSDNGNNNVFTNEIGITRIVGINGDTGIAEYGFGPCGGAGDGIASVGRKIADMPQIAGFFFKFNLSVGDSGFTLRTPVDDSVSAVDKTLLIQVDKDLGNGSAAALVHCKAFALPVA